MNRVFLSALLLVVLTACGKPESNRAPASVNISLDSSNGPVTIMPDAIVVPDTGDPNATVSQLSAELRKFVLRTRTKPRDFADFAAQAHLQAPPAPPGKKYAIAGAAVILVDQ